MRSSLVPEAFLSCPSSCSGRVEGLVVWESGLWSRFAMAHWVTWEVGGGNLSLTCCLIPKTEIRQLSPAQRDGMRWCKAAMMSYGQGPLQPPGSELRRLHVDHLPLLSLPFPSPSPLPPSSAPPIEVVTFSFLPKAVANFKVPLF